MKANATTAGPRATNPIVLSIYWFALEAHWAALLGAALQGQIARFADPSFVGRASAVLLGFGALFAIASQFVAGRASDHARRRMPFVVAGTLCDIAALFAFALAPSFITVVVAFAAIQISLNTANGPYQALIPDRVAPSQHGRASAVSPAVFQHGLVLLACAISALLLAGMLTTVFFLPEQLDLRNKRLMELEPPPVPPWHYRKSFIALIVSRSLVSLGLYSIVPFFAFFLKFALHVTAYLPTSVDLLLTMTLCSLIGTLPAGIASDRFSKKGLMYAAIAGLAIGAVGLSSASGMPVAIAVAIPLGIGWGLRHRRHDRRRRADAGRSRPRQRLGIVEGGAMTAPGWRDERRFRSRIPVALHPRGCLPCARCRRALVRPRTAPRTRGRNGRRSPIRLAQIFTASEKETIEVEEDCGIVRHHGRHRHYGRGVQQ